MNAVRAMIHRLTHDRIPWEWNDPWVWITTGVVLAMLTLMIAAIWLDVPGTLQYAAFAFMVASSEHRRERYLRRTGKRSGDAISNEIFTIMFLGLALGSLFIFFMG